MSGCHRPPVYSYNAPTLAKVCHVTTIRTIYSLLAAALILIGSLGCTKQDSVRGVRILQATILEAPPTAFMIGGYMRIENTAKHPILLLTVRSEQGTVQMHDMTVVNQLMSMRKIEGALSIGPGETLVFEPGQKHFMIADWPKSMRLGDQFTALLSFQDNQGVFDVPVVFDVKPRPPLEYEG